MQLQSQRTRVLSEFESLLQEYSRQSVHYTSALEDLQRNLRGESASLEAENLRLIDERLLRALDAAKAAYDSMWHAQGPLTKVDCAWHGQDKYKLSMCFCMFVCFYACDNVNFIKSFIYFLCNSHQ